VPGDRADRIPKAYKSSADLVILDLEDAVAEDRKSQACQSAAAFLRQHDDVVVRVNAAFTEWFTHDIDLVSEYGCLVLLPKCEDAELLSELIRRLGPGRVIGLVETAAGVEASFDLARVPGLVRMALGNADLAAQLGVDPGNQSALLYSRSRLVSASAAAGLPGPVDGVTVQTKDEDTVLADTTAGRMLGFSGKLCIHPNQVAPVHAGLAPTPFEVDWAERVLRAAGAAGVYVVDGQMVDAPVLLRARQILARAQGISFSVRNLSN
jgi:citrate lyase subunit beta/citryl-CoA lyase